MRNSEATGSVYEKLLLLCSFMVSPVSELPPGDFNLEFRKLLKGVRQGIQGLSSLEDLQEMALCSRRRNQSFVFYCCIAGWPITTRKETISPTTLAILDFFFFWSRIFLCLV